MEHPKRRSIRSALSQAVGTSLLYESSEWQKLLLGETRTANFGGVRQSQIPIQNANDHLSMKKKKGKLMTDIGDDQIVESNQNEDFKSFSNKTDWQYNLVFFEPLTK